MKKASREPSFLGKYTSLHKKNGAQRCRITSPRSVAHLEVCYRVAETVRPVKQPRDAYRSSGVALSSFLNISPLSPSATAISIFAS